MIRVVFIVFIFISFPFFLKAQILNMQKSDLEEDTSKWKGNITSSFGLYNRSAAADEPVEFFEFSLKSDFAFFFKKARLSLVNEINYLQINDDPFLNTGFQHIRFQWQVEKHIHPEAFTQFQYDNFRGLFPRILAGSGWRFIVAKKKSLSFFFGAGLMYEYENWEIPDSPSKREVEFLKSTNYLGLRWKINPNLDLNMIAYYQTTYDQDQELWRNRYSLDLNLNSKVSKRFKINTNFSLGHEDQPIVAITKTVYNFTTGLNYSF